jgi:hypothetical protein
MQSYWPAFGISSAPTVGLSCAEKCEVASEPSLYKHLIGPRLRARILAAQQREVATTGETLNRMVRAACTNGSLRIKQQP